MAHDVFISYSNQDKPTADAVCATLEAQGIRCWIAPRDIIPGKEWGEAIVAGITGARVMVVVFSHHSNESRQVMREVERAVNAGLAVLPFRIEEVTPSGSMEYFLSSTHWLDALTDNIEEHILSLASNVQALLGKEGESGARKAKSAAPPPKKPPPKAKSAASSFFSGQIKFISGAAAAIFAVILFFLFFDFGSEGDVSKSGDDAAAIAALETAGIRRIEIKEVSQQDAPAAGVQFGASLTSDEGGLTDAIKWIVYDEHEQRVGYADEAAPKMALPPGQYRLEVERDGLKGTGTFRARDKKGIRYAATLEAGWLHLRVVAAAGEQPMSGDLRWKIFDDRVDPNKPLVHSYEDRPRLLFFEGMYRVSVNKGDATVETTVEIRQGETTEMELVLGAGTLVMTATLEEGGEALTSDVGWQVYPADQPEDKAPVGHTYDPKTALLLPAGSYRVRANHHDAQAYVVVTVAAGETTEGRVNLNAGALRALARVEGKGTQMAGGLSWQVKTPAAGAAGKGKNVSHSYDDVPTFVIPAGDYEMTLKHGTAEKTAPMSVTAGQVTELEVLLSVGRLQVAAVDGDGKSEFEKDPSCQIWTRAAGAFDKPTRVWNFYGVTGEESLQSGAYTVGCKVNEREGIADADVQSGEVTTVKVTIP